MLLETTLKQAENLEKEGNFSESSFMYHKAVSLVFLEDTEGMILTYTGLVRTHIACGKIKEALTNARVLEKNKLEPDKRTLNALGIAFLFNHNQVVAETYFTQLIGRSNTNTEKSEAYSWLAYSSLEQGKLFQGIEYAITAMKYESIDDTMMHIMLYQLAEEEKIEINSGLIDEILPIEKLQNIFTENQSPFNVLAYDTLRTIYFLIREEKQNPLQKIDYMITKDGFHSIH